MRINDRYGHGVGDDVLCRFGKVAEELIRPMDSLARLGGEEFALLLPDTDQLDALLVAERVRAALSRQKLVPEVAVRVSAGISSCPGDGDTVDRLHKSADDALYCATARTSAHWRVRRRRWRPTTSASTPSRTSTRSSR